MKVLASYTIKGGVGKTAAAVNLAYLAARQGARTLIWDLDPQGACTYYFRIKPKIKGGGKRLLEQKHALEKCIKGTDYEGLDLVPSDFSYRNLDLVLDDVKRPTERLARRLEVLDSEYDYIFLDCPPNITLLSESVIEAADAVLAPIIPTTLSLRTLEQLSRFIDKHTCRAPQLLAFFSMVDKRKSLHREIMASLPQTCPALLETQIPYASDIERMGPERAVVESYARSRVAVRAYRALWREIEARLS